MLECEECGTKLGILEGYRHPTMGKKHHLCSTCFDQVSESVARWGEFVRTNSFNNGSSNNKHEFEWNITNPIPDALKIPVYSLISNLFRKN